MEKPNLQVGGAAFFDGKTGGSPSDIEAHIFYDAITKGTELCVKPEQAMVVTQILEAIYKSSETGKPVFFGE